MCSAALLLFLARVALGRRAVQSGLGEDLCEANVEAVAQLFLDLAAGGLRRDQTSHRTARDAKVLPNVTPLLSGQRRDILVAPAAPRPNQQEMGRSTDVRTRGAIAPPKAVSHAFVRRIQNQLGARGSQQRSLHLPSTRVVLDNSAIAMTFPARQ